MLNGQKQLVVLTTLAQTKHKDKRTWTKIARHAKNCTDLQISQSCAEIVLQDRNFLVGLNGYTTSL